MTLGKQDFAVYSSNENIKYLYKQIENNSRVRVTADHYLERLYSVMVALFKEMIIVKEINDFTLTEFNNMTVRVCIYDIASLHRMYKGVIRVEHMASGDVSLDGIDVSNATVNIPALLDNIQNTPTTDNILFSNSENTQDLPDFLDDNKPTYNIGIMGSGDTPTVTIEKDEIVIQEGEIASDQVNPSLLIRDQDLSSLAGQFGMCCSGTGAGAPGPTSASLIQSSDPNLTDDAYDEFVVSIDSRNRNVKLHKLPNEYTIRLLTQQGDELRGSIQNLNQVRRVFQFVLIDATIPNIMDPSTRAFDQPFIYLKIPELSRGGDMLTTSINGTRVFGKLRYEFSKDDDVFTNVFTENCYKLYKQLAFEDSLPTITIQLLDYNGNPFDFGPDGYEVTSATASNPTIMTTSEAHGLSTGNRVYIYDYRIDDVQTITFSAVPTAGSWQLNYNSEQTALFGFADTAATIETALQALSGLTDVTVTGDYSAGFTVVFTGADGGQDQPLLVVADGTTTPTGTYSLVAGVTPVTTTVAEIDNTTTENQVNNDDGHTVTNLSATTFSINIDMPYTGRQGFVMAGQRQNSFTFKIKTYGAESH